MTDFNRDEALTFIESMRLTLVNRVGFRWMVEKLTGLEAYVRVITDENEQLNRYLDWSNARDAYESYSADHTADFSAPGSELD